MMLTVQRLWIVHILFICKGRFTMTQCRLVLTQPQLKNRHHFYFIKTHRWCLFTEPSDHFSSYVICTCFSVHIYAIEVRMYIRKYSTEGFYNWWCSVGAERPSKEYKAVWSTCWSNTHSYWCHSQCPQGLSCTLVRGFPLPPFLWIWCCKCIGLHFLTGIVSASWY